MKSFTEYAQSRDVELGHSELDEGMFGNAMSALGSVAKQTFGGLAAGAKQGWNQMTGPVAKYDAAINALTALNTSMQGLSQPGPNGKSILQQLPNGTKTMADINGILKQLAQQKALIPKLTAQPATTQWGQQGQQQPGAVPPGAGGVQPPPVAATPPPMPQTGTI